MFLTANRKTAANPKFVRDDIVQSPQLETCFMTDLAHYAKNKEERYCLMKLCLFCNENNIQLQSHMLFRFACGHGFDFKKAKKAIIKNHDHPFLSVKMDDRLTAYMQNMVAFPLPGLRSKKGNSKVIFVRSSRFEPGGPETSELFLKSLSYILNTMSLTEEDCRNGITIISYLKGYGMKNFQHDPDNTLVHLIDGDIIPIRIAQILSVDANKVYSKIMKMSKPLMTKSFAEKFKVIKSKELGNYLMDGYEQYLPDEVEGGWRSAEEIVEDFCDEMRYKEHHQKL